MRTLAWVMWTVAAGWVILAIFSAENFQELCGGTSGAQFLLIAFIVALIPSAPGWRAYHRSSS